VDRRAFWALISFYRKESTLPEKVKKAEDGMVMMMNLSALASDEKALGSVLDEIESEKGFTVHFTEPWQPYSFI
jgi:hypothetical protein